MNKILLRYLLFHNLVELSQTYGIPCTTLIKAAKQFGHLISGTTISELSNSGLHWSFLTQAIIDTRSLHLWILSSRTPQDFLLRLCQYSALETVGISFGHLKKGTDSILIGGLRNLVANELASTIFYNSTQIQTVINIEQNAIAIATTVGQKGRSVIPVILKLMGGHQDEYVKPMMVLKPLDTRSIAFQNNCKSIINNMFKEHAMRRGLNRSVQRIYNTPAIISTVVTSSSLTILPTIGWIMFALTLTVFSFVENCGEILKVI